MFEAFRLGFDGAAATVCVYEMYQDQTTLFARIVSVM